MQQKRRSTEKSISLNRKFAEAYLNLALIYSRSGNSLKAQQTIDTGLAALDSSQHKIREQLVRLKVEMSLSKNPALSKGAALPKRGQ